MSGPGFAGGPNSREDGAMASKFSTEVRACAVRMVLDHEEDEARFTAGVYDKETQAAGVLEFP